MAKKKAKPESKALAIIPVNTFLAFGDDAEEVKSLIQENMGNMDAVSPFDLPRIAMPTAGGKTWSVPTMEGDTAQDEVVGVIVAWKKCRGYWPGEFSGNTPPECSSEDGQIGHGEPGGVCGDCPLSVFGSFNEDPENNRVACKEMTRLLLVTDTTLMPYLLTLPPTAQKPWRRYTMGLLSGRRKYYSVITRIGLEQTKSQGNITYSVPVFLMPPAGFLSDTDTALVKAYGDEVRPILSSPVMASDNAASGGGGEEPVEL